MDMSKDARWDAILAWRAYHKNAGTKDPNVMACVDFVKTLDEANSNPPGDWYKPNIDVLNKIEDSFIGWARRELSRRGFRAVASEEVESADWKDAAMIRIYNAGWEGTPLFMKESPILLACFLLAIKSTEENQ